MGYSLASSIKGLHHLTATTGEAAADHRFYSFTLGMRLVKKTVNFDDPKVYHFYYAGRNGSPGTVFTTFPYAGQGIRRGSPGHGQVVATGLSIPPASTGFWQERLKAHGFSSEIVEDTELPGLRTSDPAGLKIELREVEGDFRLPWLQAGIGEPFAIRGLAGATLQVPELDPALAFLQEEMGARLIRTDGLTARLQIGTDRPAHYLQLQADPRVPRGKGGMGTVHHLAFRVETLEDLKQVHHRVTEELGLRSTGIKDRKYFQSIYFRFPGGVLFEVATSSPGFTADEAEASLGEKLMLPAWAEQERGEIEAQLPAYS